MDFCCDSQLPNWLDLPSFGDLHDVPIHLLLCYRYAVVQTYLIFWANKRTSTIQEGNRTALFT